MNLFQLLALQSMIAVSQKDDPITFNLAAIEAIHTHLIIIQSLRRTP